MLFLKHLRKENFSKKVEIYSIDKHTFTGFNDTTADPFNQNT